MIKNSILAVRLKFTEDILGSLPADQDLYTRFVSSKAPSPWLKAEEDDMLAERTTDTGVTVFPQDEVGLFLFNYHIKGFLKEAANVLKEQIGVKNARSKIDNNVFINPRRIYFTRHGENIKEPDGYLERPLRAETMRGPRVALAASEVLHAPVEIEFKIQILEHKEVNVEVVKALLEYGKLKGLGQWRNGGYGQFEFEVLNCDEQLVS